MVHGDDNGLVLPPFVAPIQIVIIPIQMQKEGVLEKARELKNLLESNDIRVKLDESDKTPGWKFSEYEMKGVPLRIEVGPRDLQNGVVTICKRNDGKKETLKFDDVLSEVKRLLKVIHEEMYQAAVLNLSKNIKEAHNLAELEAIVSKGGYAKVMWCGERACEDKVKEMFNATSRCMPFAQVKIDDKCAICGREAKYLVLFAKAY